MESYSDEEVAKAADALAIELGVSVDHDSHMWLALRLGISKGIGMGYDRLGEWVDERQPEDRIMPQERI